MNTSSAIPVMIQPRIAEVTIGARDDFWLDACVVHRSADQRELLAVLSSGSGFLLLDPATGEHRQIGATCGGGWAIGQALDGDIWYAVSHQLWRWRWGDADPERVFELPRRPSLCIINRFDFLPDGHLVVPDKQQQQLFCCDPESGSIRRLEVEQRIGSLVACDRAGWIYLETDGGVLAFHPKRRTRQVIPAHVMTHCRHSLGERVIDKDREGRVVISMVVNGEKTWHECLDGQTSPLPPEDMTMAQTEFVDGAWREPVWRSLLFDDGSRVTSIDKQQVTIARADGTTDRLSFQFTARPVQNWCLTSGGGRIWGGCVFPAGLWSYDPADGSTTYHENLTGHGGEFYQLVWSRGRLFGCSYRFAKLTCLDPSLSEAQNRAFNHGPENLGYMMEGRDVHLERSHGSAKADDGTVFFAARGDYGCTDSGICAIEPDSLTVQKWIFPDSNFEALAWLPDRKQLLVGECRRGEGCARASILCPQTGAIMHSYPIFNEPGDITSWLVDAQRPHLIYGMFPYRGTLFLLDLNQRKVVRTLPEITHNGIPGSIRYNMLVHGPDGRIWGLTSEAVFAVDLQLTKAEIVTTYDGDASYLFGFAKGPDGHFYFQTRHRLLRLEITT